MFSAGFEYTFPGLERLQFRPRDHRDWPILILILRNLKAILLREMLYRLRIITFPYCLLVF